MSKGVYGFHRVPPTEEERAEFKRTHWGYAPRVYRMACDRCGKRIWASGLGIGSHRRACKGERS